MKVITNRWGRNAQSRDIREMLGLGDKDKLPVEGMDARIVQGVKIWVTPLVGFSKRKRSTHRVLAECPECGKHLSAGRLHQHKCPRVCKCSEPAVCPIHTADAPEAK